MNNDLSQLSQNVQGAQTSASNLAAQTPGLLQSLKSNLTNIFTKDNPVIEARGQALSDFLSTPAKTRAEFLPSNLPNVEGSPLNLSPTQQSAITSSRESAAFAPLAGLNQIVSSLFGNIPGLVSGAGDIFQSQIQQEQNKANIAQQQFDNAFRQLEFGEQKRQFNVKQSDTKLTSTQKKQVFDIDAGLGSLSKAKKEIAEARFLLTGFRESREDPQIISGNVSGTGPSFLRNFRRGGALGGLSEESQKLEARLSNINATIFETSGKALTGTEVEILSGKIPSTKEDEQNILVKLEELDAEINRKAIQIASQMSAI